MSSRKMQALRSSLASTCGRRRSRLAASSSWTRLAVEVHSTWWPSSTSSWPMAARAWLFPTPGLPAASRLTASATKAPLRRRSSCWQMSGGKRSSCRVAKVLSGGRPESRCRRATRCSSRCRHSARTSSYKKASCVRLPLAALSARSSYRLAMAGSFRARSMLRSSVWRSAMRHLLTEQAVVGAQVQHRRAELRDVLHGRRTDQVAHGVERRRGVLVQQPPERRLDLAFGGAGRQVQQPHIVPIGTLGHLRSERVVGPAEGQAGEQIVAVAVVGERTRLADQRPDDVAVVNAMLTMAEQPRHAQQVRRGAVDLQRLGAHPHQERGADQPRRDRVGVAQHLDGAEAADRHAQFAAQPEWRRRQWPQGLAFLEPAALAGEVALLDQVLQEAGVGGAVVELTAAAHPQRLIDGSFELEM